MSEVIDINRAEKRRVKKNNKKENGTTSVGILPTASVVIYQGKEYPLESFVMESTLDSGATASFKVNAILNLKKDEPIILRVNGRYTHFVIENFQRFRFPEKGVEIDAVASIQREVTASQEVVAAPTQNSTLPALLKLFVEELKIHSFNGTKMENWLQDKDASNIIWKGTTRELVLACCSLGKQHFRVPQRDKEEKDLHHVLEIGDPAAMEMKVIVDEIIESGDDWLVVLSPQSEIPLVGTRIKVQEHSEICGAVHSIQMETEETKVSGQSLNMTTIKVSLRIKKILKNLIHSSDCFYNESASCKFPAQYVAFRGIVYGVVSKVEPFMVTCFAGEKQHDVRGVLYGYSALKGKCQIQPPVAVGDPVLAFWPADGLFFGDIPVLPFAAIQKIPELLTMISPDTLVQGDKIEVKTKGIDINKL